MAAKYKAFISYSHADEQWAKWLQRAIERYRVPARLVGSSDSGQQIPKRLFPVFRDRSELASSSDLGASLQQALQDSENLIVVCSPAAAKSRWLNEEVRYYKSLGRGDRVLCFMVEGTPDTRSPDCAFPPELFTDDGAETGAEHLAADPRDDGKRGALLKIIGGLLRVGIDDLKQRDAQRRMRALAGIAAASVVVAVAMVFLALYAVAAQKEAELRRGQAEDLIGFMLGDLRSRLQPIGKLDLLDAVGDEAMKYFEALDDNATAQDLFSRAMALRQIGEVRFDQRRLEPALQAFEESRSVLQRLHEQEEVNDDYLFELGQSEFWVGYVHYERSQNAAARAAMERYMDISVRLLELQPDNLDYLSELAYAYSNLGSVARAQGDREAAIRYFRESAAINERQLEQTPDDASMMVDLAGGYSWIGSAEQDLGNLRAAETAFRQALEKFSSANELKFDVRTEEEVAGLRLLLGSNLVMQGRVEEALDEARNSYRMYQGLVAGDPENLRWRRGKAEAARDIGERSFYLRLREKVLPILDESLALYESIAEVDPDNSVTRIRHAGVQEVKTRVLLDQGDVSGAASLIRVAVASIDNVPIEERDNLRYVTTLGFVVLTYDRVLQNVDSEEETLPVVRRAYETVRNWSQSSLLITALLAELALAMDDTAAAQSYHDELRDTGFAHPWYTSQPSMGSGSQ